jgi:hypothetical protein
VASEDDAGGPIQAVVTLGEFARKRAFVKLLVLGSGFVEGPKPWDVAWLFEAAAAEIRKFYDLEATRLLVARQGEARELVGPYLHPRFLAGFSTAGFRELATLNREGGREIGVEIYERASVAA